MQKDLTLRQARELLAAIPDEHLDRLVIVSVEAGYVTEALTSDWEVRKDGVVLIHTTGDR